MLQDYSLYNSVLYFFFCSEKVWEKKKKLLKELIQVYTRELLTQTHGQRGTWPAGLCLCVCVCLGDMLLLGRWVVTLQRNMDQWSNTADTDKEVSAPSFNLHYTVHSLRSALLKRPPPNPARACVCVHGCVCVSVLSHFPYFLSMCGASVAMVIISRRDVSCFIVSLVLNWSVSMFQSSQDSFFSLSCSICLFLW